MAHVMSTSAKKPLPVLNDRCTLRRNVSVQPYGRCTVCSLELKQCHAWQSSVMSFALIILLLVPLVIATPWIIKLAIAAALGLLVLQGTVNHKRTDELILNQHRLVMASNELRSQQRALEAARDNLERAVAERTRELRDANAFLAAANLELEAVAAAREKMVLEVSHDLRTPLTSVKGAAENLLDGIAGPLSSDASEYVQIVRDHAERLIGAVGQLLERARSRERASVELARESVELSELVRDVARGLMPIASERGIALDVSAAPSELVADRSKLRLVLENLLGNALKFTDSGGRVELRLEDAGHEVRVCVSDTGIGMAQDDAKHVFDRFYRASEARPGSGMGLAIVRDLVRLHRGDIAVHSEPGRGSAFTVSLPRSAA